MIEGRVEQQGVAVFCQGNVENLQQVVIDKPAPQELDEDWNPWWYERAFANWDDDVK